MVRKRRHPIGRLTAVKARNLRAPGRHADGNGLYLVVDPSGSKRWILRTMAQGKRRDIGLGGLRLVSLADAREQAARYRKIARDGGNPIEVKRKAQRVVPTFRAAAEGVHEAHRDAWRNEKHVNQWINTLKDYAFPFIGDRRVDQIETSDILKVLAPIWLTKPETARRVRQRMRTVFDWVKASGHRSGDNPVDGARNGHGLPRQSKSNNHHAALPYADAPAFMEKLRACGGRNSILISAYGRSPPNA